MATTTIGSGPDSLVLRVSQDAFQGDAQYTVKVGGVQVGGILAASAARNAGQHDTLTLLGDWGPGNHPVNVTFLNDAYDGSGDRNLYLEGATYNGKEVAGASAAMLAAEQENFFFIEPGSGPGYTVVLADDFSRGYDSLHWGDPFPLPAPTGPTSNYGAMWNPSGVAVRDGEMQVAMTRQADGTWTVGGFNSFKAGFGILYGTVEFDARVEHVQGTMAAFLMWPATDTWPPEIDILETPKSEAMHVLHFGSTSDPGASVLMGGPDPSQWHHYKLTWLPDLVRIETDGQVVASWNYASPDVPMGFGAMGFVGTGSDGWMGGAPDSSAPSVVTAHLDNVVMSQWNGIA
jgi:Glycosyl hydrolases family 16/Ca-dependent carbohydrate-binding module xylan-binding